MVPADDVGPQMSDPTRYPLAWPAHRPRRPARQRIAGQFSEAAEGGKTQRVSLPSALDRIEDQVRRLGGIYPILSTNIEPRLDGRPRAGTAAPADPGVCIYFRLKDAPYAMACDTFTEVSQNIAAIAAHIEATRRIERYGVATAAETLQAFSALPPPPAAVIALGNGPPWRETMGFPTDFPPPGLGPDEIRDLLTTRYRSKAKGRNEPELKDLNRARDAAQAELKL